MSVNWHFYSRSHMIPSNSISIAKRERERTILENIEAQTSQSDNTQFPFHFLKNPIKLVTSPAILNHDYTLRWIFLSNDLFLFKLPYTINKQMTKFA